MKDPIKKIAISAINFYRNYISPFKLRSCRFYPSCSEYAGSAIEKHGLIKGSLRGLLRLMRCNPFSRGGYDPA